MTKRIRRLLPIIFAALFVAGCGGQKTAPPRAPSNSWTQFRLNPQHNPVLKGKLRVLWRIETGGAFSSSPAIAGSALYIGNNKGVLYAINVHTGRILWTFHVSAPLMSNPLIYQGLVIVGEGDQQFFYRDRYHPFVVGPSENALIALDARNGSTRWRIPLAGAGMPTPAIIDGQLIHHNGGGLLTISQPQSGVVRYSIDLRSSAAMTAILPIGGDRFVTAGGITNELLAMNAKDGRIIWRAPISGLVWGASDCPPAFDGRLILCNYNSTPDGRFEIYRPGLLARQHAYAVDAQTGRTVWNVSLETGQIPPWNASAIPLVVKTTIYFGSTIAPYVHALATEDGRVRWRLRVRGPVKGGLVEKDGVLYFGDLGGYLWAVDARTGKAIGSKNMHSSFNVGSPVIDGQTLIIGSKTGSLLAVPIDTIRSAHDVSATGSLRAVP